MARRPSRDEPIPLGKDAGTTKDRVFVKDLARYLRISCGALKKWADDRGILYRVSRGACFEPIPYVTEQTAMRAIGHFRAKQGAECMKNRRFFEEKEQERLAMARRRALKGAKAPTNGGLTPQLPLANPRAGTEDEP